MGVLALSARQETTHLQVKKFVGEWIKKQCQFQERQNEWR
jgi:hypothetical protein